SHLSTFCGFHPNSRPTCSSSAGRSLSGHSPFTPFSRPQKAKVSRCRLSAGAGALASSSHLWAARLSRLLFSGRTRWLCIAARLLRTPVRWQQRPVADKQVVPLVLLQSSFVLEGAHQACPQLFFRLAPRLQCRLPALALGAVLRQVTKHPFRFLRLQCCLVLQLAVLGQPFEERRRLAPHRLRMLCPEVHELTGSSTVKTALTQPGRDPPQSKLSPRRS